MGTDNSVSKLGELSNVNNNIFLILLGAIMVVIVWLLVLQLHMQSVPITIKVVSSNSADGEVYLKQHYVIKFDSDLRQVGGFLRFPPSIKLTATI